MSRSVLVGCCAALFLLVVGASGSAAEPAPVPKLADYVESSPAFARVRTFCDRMIDQGRDHYGPKKLRIWPNAYDIERRTVPVPEEPWSRHISGHAPFVCNLQQQSSLIRLLWHMTDLTGEAKYRQAVEDCMRDYFAHCTHPETGAFAWGTHCSYDVVRDEVMTRGDRGLLEEKITDVPWEIFYQCDSEATLRMIDHMRLCFNREMATYFHHREMDRTECRTPDRMFNTDNDRGNHPYTVAGVVYLKAWAFAYSKTDDPKYVEWIERLYDIHVGPLDREVGLITEIPNLFRLRKWPASENEWYRRSVMVKYGDPYMWGYYLFKVGDYLGGERRAKYHAGAEDQLARWPKHAWDPQAKKYWSNFPIYPPESDEAVEISEANYFTQQRHGTFWEVVRGKQGYHQLVTAYLAYANAYRRTGKESYRAVADHLREVYVDSASSGDESEPQYALLLAIYLQANAELYQRSRDQVHRREAARAYDRAVKQFYRDRFFLGKVGVPWCSHTYGSDDLALAVLRWDMTRHGLECPVEDGYLFDWGYSYP